MSFANDAFLRRAIVGQLTELTFPENWEEFGILSVDDTLALVHDALSTLSLICAEEQSTMYVYATRDSNMPATQDVITPLTGMTATFDSGQWDNANQRVNIDTDGLYIARASMGHQGGTAVLRAYTRINASDMNGLHFPAGVATITGIHPVFVMPLFAGDHITISASHSDGSQINTVNGSIRWFIFRLGSLV